MAEAVEIIEDDPIEVRRAKREALIAAGIDPYGHSVKRSHSVGELNEKYAHLEDGESTEDEVLIAGRVMAKRVQGKIAFLELRESGCDIQLFCRINALGEEAFAALCDLDVGDWIAVHGTMMRTKRGQLSVAVDSFELMSKSLRPLPEKFHGLDGQGDPLPSALCRPRHEPRGAHHFRAPLQDRLGHPPLHGGARATTRWRRRFCMPSSAGRTRSPSSRTSTRSTATTTCASPRSCR